MASQHLTQQTEYWLSCFQAIGQHQGDEPAILRWLLAHPINWQREAQSQEFALAASKWLGHASGPGSDIMAIRVLATCGNILQQYPLGNYSQQLELALVAYRQVLSELSPTVYSLDCGITLNNLATVYRHRLLGNRAENLETAIILYRQVLGWHYSERLAPLYPVLLTGLANAYCERKKGKPRNNLARAISHYKQALRALPADALPFAHTFVRHYLAVAQGYQREGRCSNAEVYRAGY